MYLATAPPAVAVPLPLPVVAGAVAVAAPDDTVKVDVEVTWMVTVVWGSSELAAELGAADEGDKEAAAGVEADAFFVQDFFLVMRVDKAGAAEAITGALEATALEASTTAGLEEATEATDETGADKAGAEEAGSEPELTAAPPGPATLVVRDPLSM